MLNKSIINRFKSLVNHNSKKLIFKDPANKFNLNGKFELEIRHWKSDYAICKIKNKNCIPFSKDDIATFNIITRDNFYSSKCLIIESSIKNSTTQYKLKVLEPFHTIEKRQFYRLPDKLDIIFTEDSSIHNRYKATSVNISLGGISMNTSRLIINPNNLSFFIDINGSYFKVKGDVVSDPKLSENAKYNYRIKFHKLKKEQESLLYKYILDKQKEINSL